VLPYIMRRFGKLATKIDRFVQVFLTFNLNIPVRANIPAPAAPNPHAERRPSSTLTRAPPLNPLRNLTLDLTPSLPTGPAGQPVNRRFTTHYFLAKRRFGWLRSSNPATLSSAHSSSFIDPISSSKLV
jgi:hypothetical protein